jgi:guanylate kinase
VKKPGLIIVVAAPSGAGKRTVIERLRALREEPFGITVSATTRPPRTGEKNGTDYFFLDRTEFQSRLAAGDFIEQAEVHGNLYGTLRAEMERISQSGLDVFLELDIQGVRNLWKLGYDFVSVFIMPPSEEELERRLRGRGTDSEEVIALRLHNARGEIASCNEFEYIVVNDDVSRAAADLDAIIRAEKCRARRFIQE